LNAWTVDQTQILSRRELAAVIGHLKHPDRRRWVNNRMNLALFRLSCCAGLRVSEACGLRLKDVKTGLEKPYIAVRKAVGKGKKARRIPLWWDLGTLNDLTAWKRERQEQGGKVDDFFLCSQADGSFGKTLTRGNARRRFIGACKALGAERQGEVTIHDGRHSFVSHALAGGRTLAEVKAAAGHGSISVTSIYCHIAVDDDGSVGRLFAFVANEPTVVMTTPALHPTPHNTAPGL